jgi:hypothetical protein
MLGCVVCLDLPGKHSQVVSRKINDTSHNLTFQRLIWVFFELNAKEFIWGPEVRLLKDCLAFDAAPEEKKEHDLSLVKRTG